jgi:cytochrome oxidase Cu insertion factor (SCO1/SenC/PrrC family)
VDRTGRSVYDAAESQSLPSGGRPGAGRHSPPEETSMERVTVNTPAPDFTLDDYTGRPVALADFRGQWVLTVFNRGFL